MKTGLHDIHGIPIHVGDLIRVKHYRHVRNRRQMYVYFKVIELSGRFFVKHWADERPGERQCLLQDAGQCEVLDHCGLEYDDKRNIVTFNERKRLTKEPQQ